jgi:hypothetical protein
MGYNAQQLGRSKGAISGSGASSVQSITANRSVYWGEGCNTTVTTKQLADTSNPPTTVKDSRGRNINNNQTLYNDDTGNTYACDTTIYFKAQGVFVDCVSGNKTANSTVASTKTDAQTPTLDDTPTLDNATSSSIRVNNGSTDSFTPATVESAVDLKLQYKKTSEGSWTTWGTELNSDVTGYADTTCGTDTVTGLVADTSYDFRYWLDRSTTVNGTTNYYSASSSTSTLPDEPTVTTNAATDITAGTSGVPNDGTAALHALVDLNNQYPSGDCEYRFVWDTTPTGGTYGNSTSWTTVGFNDETDESAEAEAIGSLTESTEYGFRAEIRWNSGTETANGSELTFNVPADPGAEAIAESQCNRLETTAKYGVATTVKFHLKNIAANGTDRYVTSASPFGSTNVYLFKDGSYDSNLTSSVLSQVSASKQLYSISLTAANLSCNYADIIVTDDATAHADLHIKIFTEINLGNVDIDSGQNTNTTAAKLTGIGTGHGLEAIGGATGEDIQGIFGNHVTEFGTIASSASSTKVTLGAEAPGVTTPPDTSEDYYNGEVILFYSGAGAGQARVVADYYGQILTDAQDETSYDNSPATEGTFSGGTGHAAADVITLACSCTVTVDNETGGVVDQFTVSSTNCTGVTDNVAEAQTSTTGSGVSFTLTPDEDNLTANKTVVLNKALGNYASDPVDNTTKYVILNVEDMFLNASNPGAEITTMPTFASDFADMLQYIFEKWSYKHTETATVHKILKAADDTTAEIQYAVDFDGSTETKNRSEDV